MKKVMVKVLFSFGFILAFALPFSGQDKESDRVENAGKFMKEILNAPDSIPQSVLDKADCVVILPSVLKFAIGIGSSYGRGVMTCRGGARFHGPWGAPSMMALEGGKIGADASAAAGPVGRTASAETDVTLRAEIL